MKPVIVMATAISLLAIPFETRAQEAVEGANRPVLLVEPMSEEWRERLLTPLLSHLAGMGEREVVPSAPDTALLRVAAEDDTLALLRRSHITADAPAVEHLELGPAACLALVAHADTGAASYADLNYVDPGHTLRIVFASDSARDLFAHFRERFPLSRPTSEEVRPAMIGIQRLGTGEADMLVLDVPRRSRSGAPAEKLVSATKRGHTILSLPTTAPALGLGLLPGEVQTTDAPFWGEPGTRKTYCDPFVLAIRPAHADKLVHKLYSSMASDSRVETGLFKQILQAARGLGTVIAASLPLSMFRF